MHYDLGTLLHVAACYAIEASVAALADVHDPAQRSAAAAAVCAHVRAQLCDATLPPEVRAHYARLANGAAAHLAPRSQRALRP